MNTPINHSQQTVAELIAEMEAALKRVVAAAPTGTMPEVTLLLKARTPDEHKLHFEVWDGEHYSVGETLEEAVSKVDPKRARIEAELESIKKRMAALQKELEAA